MSNNSVQDSVVLFRQRGKGLSQHIYVDRFSSGGMLRKFLSYSVSDLILTV